MKYTGIKPPIQIFPKCDENGKIIEEKKEDKKPSSYMDRKFKGQIFRLINGKARAKLSRTKEIDNFLIVDSREIDDLLCERFYVVNCPLLLEKLKKEKKAWKFAFSFGNGFKVYLAYIHTSELYKDVLFMTMGTAQKSNLIKEIVEDIKSKEGVRTFEVDVMGVNRATPEELLQLT